MHMRTLTVCWLPEGTHGDPEAVYTQGPRSTRNESHPFRVSQRRKDGVFMWVLFSVHLTQNVASDALSINGGMITGNKAQFGGGVSAGQPFPMNGGETSGIEANGGNGGTAGRSRSLFPCSRILCRLITRNSSRAREEKKTRPKVIPMAGIWIHLANRPASPNSRTARLTENRAFRFKAETALPSAEAGLILPGPEENDK